MKKILLYMFLFLGNITLMAQTVKGNYSNNDISYEQALEALKQRKFIVRFNTEDYRAQRRKQLDNETNFLILEGNSVSYQYDDGRREYRHVGGNGTFYVFPKVEKGKASNIEISKDKNNNMILSMKVRGKASYSSFKIKIVLESGTNNCTVTKTNSSGNSYYTGTLYPIGSTTVMKAN